MKLSMFMASVFIIANSTHCAAFTENSSSNDLDNNATKTAWTSNPIIAGTIAYNIGANYRLCAYHEQSPEHKIYTWLTETDDFGFAFVPTTGTTEPLSELLQVSKEAFLAAQTAGRKFFQMRESCSLSTPVLSTTALAYAFCTPHKPRRYLFLCTDEKVQKQITAEFEAYADRVPTLEDAARHLRLRLPLSSYVLFDVAAYCRKVFDVSHKAASQTRSIHRRTKST